MKKVLCIGNNSEDTDVKTTELAILNNSINNGLIVSPDTTEILPGYYHTSLFDLSVSQIKAMSTQFDQIVFLDQPLDEWDHPNAYYLTVSLLNDIKNTKVTKLGQTKNIEFFENLVNTNKSFCIYPFIELLVINGDTTVCCRSDNPITKLNNIKDWRTDKNYKAIRDKMLAGELVPEHCSTCYRYEAQGIKSARQQETVEWANRLQLSSLEDIANIDSPVYYEVRPGNKCNLQCRSCSPSNSSLIEKEYKKQGWLDTNITFNYTGFDFIKFNNLEKLYVAGGEPTAMSELYDFMQNCVDQQNTDFEFVINTNANKIPEKFFNLCKQFSNLQFIVSIDGFEKVNDYVRWLSNWDNTIQNSKKLKANHTITFNVVVSIYTITRLHQLFSFFDTEFPNSLVRCVMAESIGDILHPNNYPDRESLVSNLSKIKNLNCYANDLVLKNFIDGLIEYYKTNEFDNIEKLKLFFEFNDRLDSSRNVHLKDYIPELDKFRTMVLK